MDLSDFFELPTILRQSCFDMKLEALHVPPCKDAARRSLRVFNGPDGWVDERNVLPRQCDQEKEGQARCQVHHCDGRCSVAGRDIPCSAGCRKGEHARHSFLQRKGGWCRAGTVLRLIQTSCSHDRWQYCKCFSSRMRDRLPCHAQETCWSRLRLVLQPREGDCGTYQGPCAPLRRFWTSFDKNTGKG